MNLEEKIALQRSSASAHRCSCPVSGTAEEAERIKTLPIIPLFR